MTTPHVTAFGKELFRDRRRFADAVSEEAAAEIAAAFEPRHERQLRRDALALRLRANAALQTKVADAMSADRADAAQTFRNAAAVMLEAARELCDG